MFAGQGLLVTGAGAGGGVGRQVRSHRSRYTGLRVYLMPVMNVSSLSCVRTVGPQMHCTFEWLQSFHKNPSAQVPLWGRSQAPVIVKIPK